MLFHSNIPCIYLHSRWIARSFVTATKTDTTIREIRTGGELGPLRVPPSGGRDFIYAHHARTHSHWSKNYRKFRRGRFPGTDEARYALG